MSRTLAIIASIFCAVTLVSAAEEQPRPAVTHEQVAGAIGKGIEFLRSRQAEDGSWPYAKPEHVQGATALAVFALSEAGVPADDPAIVNGIKFVLSRPIGETYNAGCTAMALESVDPATYIRGIAAARDYLVKAQNARGMWSYTKGDPLRTVGDNSNSQFAVLGLHSAMSVGLEVPEETLGLAETHYGTSQNKDGGWGYRPGDKSYGSMTAAGVASLYILGSRLYVESDVCGQYRQDPRIAAGVQWLDRHYTVTKHPLGSASYLYYYLYALERVGVLTGLREIGGGDWYIDGARFVVGSQNPDGSWTGGRDQVPNSCFALLFLSKGNVPVLINKLMHDGDWNVDVHDAANFTGYVSSLFGQRVGWQAISLDESTETLLSAPVLYVTGHAWPSLRASDIAKLESFFERGGFMFAEACCGSREFDRGVREFTRRLFPDFRLERLDRTHGVYRSYFRLTNSNRRLEGIEAGCRTVLIYSPRDLSCTWERGDLRQDEEAFKFAANIAAFVTGKERLQPKLAQRDATAAAKFVSAPAGAFTFAQVVYAGLWNPHPASGPKLLAFLNEKAGVNVAPEQVSVTLVDKNLGNYPFLYMTGLNRFTLGEAEKKAIKSYLERGGFLFADASAGRAPFDESFRTLVAEVLPSSPLEPIPPDSPIYRMAFDTRKVTYTAAVRELNPDLDTLTLYGAKVNGRIAVVYSPYDIGCALEQFPAYGSKGLVSEDAFRVAANIVLYALTY